MVKSTTLVPSLALLIICCTEGMGTAERLSLRGAIETALRQHPTLSRSAADREAFAADAEQAATAFRPRISAQGSVRDDLRDPLDVTSSTPVGWSNIIGYDATLTASKLLTDSGRTQAQVAGIRAGERQARGQLAIDRLDVELAVVRAYLDVLRGTELLAVSTGAVVLVEAQRARSAALFKATLRPEIDVLSAETQLTQAQLARMRDENSIATAKVALQNAMGGHVGPGHGEVTPIEIAPLAEEAQVSSALTEGSLARRPELVVLRDGIAVSEAGARLARTRRSPTVIASAGANASSDVATYPWGGARQWLPGVGAFVSLSITWDLYLGDSDSYERRGMEARVRSGQAELERTQQTIELAVERARLAVEIAGQARVVAAAYRSQAERQLQLAKARYESGVGNFVELNDARTQLVSAQRQEVQARYDLAFARVALARELGHRPGDLAREVSPPGATTP